MTTSGNAEFCRNEDTPIQSKVNKRAHLLQHPIHIQIEAPPVPVNSELKVVVVVVLLCGLVCTRLQHSKNIKSCIASRRKCKEHLDQASVCLDDF